MCKIYLIKIIRPIKQRTGVPVTDASLPQRDAGICAVLRGRVHFFDRGVPRRLAHDPVGDRRITQYFIGIRNWKTYILFNSFPFVWVSPAAGPTFDGKSRQNRWGPRCPLISWEIFSLLPTTVTLPPDPLELQIELLLFVNKSNKLHTRA